MIKQAIIPLAGLGTRMLPLSKSFPKELWPLGEKSILEYILDECFEAGIKEIIFIVSKKKEIIKKYFSRDISLEKKVASKPELLKFLKNLNKVSGKIKFAYQENPKGLGHAVLCAKKYIKSKHFLLLLPDDIIKGKNCSKELIKINNKTKSSVVALRKVIKTDVKRYGIVGFKDIKKLMINKMVEKPSVKSSPSQYAIIGRYILNKSIFSFLTNQKSGKLGEIQITDAMNSMLINEKFYGCKFSGKYLDCGTKEGYINSFIDINKK